MLVSRLLLLAGYFLIAASLYAQVPCRAGPAEPPIENCARTTNAPPAHVPVRTGGNVTNFRELSKRVEPVYPEAALKARVSGTVIVNVTVNELGLVYEARVMRGHQLLNKAALDAVLQWQYFPLRVKGEAMPFITTATLVFTPPPRSAAGQAPEFSRYRPEGAASAEDLLRQAREAAGGEALRSVTSFTASISLRRFVEFIEVSPPTKVARREKTLKGRISIECSFPDKFLKRISTSTLSGYKYSYLETVNGNRAWRDPPLQAASQSRDRHAIDVSDFEQSLAYQAQGARQQMNFYALALLVHVFPEAKLRFNSAGWKLLEGRKVDIILVFGLEDYSFRLLIDQESHLLVGMESSFLGPRRLPVVLQGASFDYRSARLAAQKAKQEQQAQNRLPQQARIIQIRFSDHRPVAGVLMPHRITTVIDGRLAEEMEVTKYQINTRINAKDFGSRPDAKK